MLKGSSRLLKVVISRVLPHQVTRINIPDTISHIAAHNKTLNLFPFMPYTDALQFIIVFSTNLYIGIASVQEAPELLFLLMQIKVFNYFILISMFV